jgi:hypothetical protein
LCRREAERRVCAVAADEIGLCEQFELRIEEAERIGL